MSITSGHIVWANGPYPCGRFPDIKIFNHILVSKLDRNEKVLADGGYSGVKCVINLDDQTPEYSSTLRARHETVNRRLKHFNVLSQRFRHDLTRHSMCFHAIVNLTQIMLGSTNPLFSP